MADKQTKTAAYYERVALQRGVQGSRNSNRQMKYAEGYQRIFPQVAEVLQ